MKWLSPLAVMVLAACSASPELKTVEQWQNICNSSTGHVEIIAAGKARELGIFRGPSGRHERLMFWPDIVGENYMNPLHRRVDDNIDITGFIPIHFGDRIELQGQYECNDGVIHWTHHDPSGRHPAGYIKVNGRIYQ